MRPFSESVAPAAAINAAVACFHGLHEKIVQLFSESVAPAAAINAAVACFHGLHEKIVRRQTKLWRLKHVVRQGDASQGCGSSR